LQEKLKPYFLQRLKVDFLNDKLPSKIEVVVWTHLSGRQRQLYNDFVTSKESVVRSILLGEKSSPLEAISWLKKLCGHPLLIEKQVDESSLLLKDVSPSVLVTESAKLGILLSMIHSFSHTDHRTLVFSQSTKMLDIIQKVLTANRVQLSRIDGQTKEKDRQKFVDDFNSKQSRAEVMLLSTKAAGQGLTLIGADRVIIYDPSW
jgi:SNF2 family DNA or RNA helicase